MTDRELREALESVMGSTDTHETVLPVERTSLLVVDDEAASSRALVRLLRDDGFTVELAADGGLAIARLSRDPVPHVLISDLHLPGADGMAVASYARSRDPEMHVVFITARPELPRRHRFEPLETVFKKPVDYQSLYTHLLHVTGHHPPPSRKPR